jgi:hypothetical protein
MTTLYLVVFIIFTHLNSSLSEKITNETEAQLFLKDVDKKLGEMKSNVIFTQWNFDTESRESLKKNLNYLKILNILIILELYYDLQIEETDKFNIFFKDLWKNVTRFDFSNFKDYSTKRQFQLLSILGIAALDKKDSNRVVK